MSNAIQLIHVAAFVLAGGLCLWGANRARSLRDDDIRRSFVAFLLTTGAWGVASGLTLLASTPATMEAGYIAGLVLGLVTVVAWLWFCSAYTGRAHHRNRRLQALVLGVTGVIVAIKATNPLHGVYYDPAVATAPFVHFAPELSLLHWVTTGLTYVASGVGVYLLFEMYAGAGVRTTKLTALTCVLALPVVPKLVALSVPGTVPVLFYEPLGTAVFAVGVLTVGREPFLAVRVPARNHLAEYVDSVVVVVDDDGRIADYNDNAATVFPEVPTRVGERIDTVLPELTERDCSPIELSVDGDDRYYSVSSSAVTTGSRQVGRAYVLSDVTELEKQRRRLRRQTDHIDSLTDAMAHELRNPLAIVCGRLESALDQSSPQASEVAGQTTVEDRSHVASALDAAERMDGVIRDLVAAIGHGKPITETGSHDLETVLRTAWDGECDGETAFECESTTSASIVAERARCIELFHYLFQTHRERGADTVQVTVDDDSVVVESDGRAFETQAPEKLFQYGQEAGEDVRMLLANAWTLANLHGWRISAGTQTDRLRIAVDGVELVESAEPSGAIQ